MQPANPHPRRLARGVPALSVFVNHANPRQRNRLHNQAIKRAKVNVGKHRDQLIPNAHDNQNDPRNLLEPLVGYTNAQVDACLTTSAIPSSPRVTIPSGGLLGDPFGVSPISADGCAVSAVDHCEANPPSTLKRKH